MKHRRGGAERLGGRRSNKNAQKFFHVIFSPELDGSAFFTASSVAVQWACFGPRGCNGLEVDLRGIVVASGPDPPLHEKHRLHGDGAGLSSWARERFLSKSNRVSQTTAAQSV